MAASAGHSRAPRSAGGRWAPPALILLQSALYGFGDPISKAAYETIPVYTLLSVRYGIALLFLLLLFRRRLLEGLRRCSPRDWLLPSLCIGGAYVVGNVAIQLTAVTAVAFLRSLSTVMTPLLALVFFRRKLRLRQIPLLFFVVLGLYLLCGLGGLSGFGLGELLALVTALLLAGSLLFGEKALERVDPVTLTTLQVAVSFVMAAVCVPLFEGGWQLEAATPLIWGIILYLAILCTVSGYFLQNAALRHISARTVALLQCSCPVMTALFSFLLLGERLSPAGLLGAAILLACVAGETIIGEES